VQAHFSKSTKSRHALIWIGRQTRALDPGCFALVMATGITSSALLSDGQGGLSNALFAVNLFAYPWLMLLTIVRIARFSSDYSADLLNPRVVFSFFTIVAASNVFGVQLALRGFAEIALLLWLFALTVWLVLSYFSFGLLALLDSRPVDLLHGGWLLAIVGTQSLVLLGARLSAGLPQYEVAVLLLLLALWTVGLALYAIFVTLFAQRIFVSPVTIQDVTPVLWVVMGAAAISANAGSALLAAEGGLAFLRSAHSLIASISFMVWAWGTWWIPLLVLLGVWKHLVRGTPLSYTPMLWSVIFPVGMYAVATNRLSLTAELPQLQIVSRVAMWVALAAWAVTVLGLAVASARSFRSFARCAVITPAG
jgi:tellurite resistance protein TehA-like permease